MATLRDALGVEWEPVTRMVPDERPVLEETLRRLADVEACCLVLTTGGTGPAPRDVTPEATEEVCDRLLPGFGEHMRRVSVSTVPTAILSRQTAGLRGKTLMVNLPGKPAAARDCLKAILPAAVHAVKLLGGPSLLLRDTPGPACGSEP